MFSSGVLLAQTPEEMVKKDYPKLYNDFKSEVGSQKARYVFAIDISNSMKPYEAAVKANLQNFVNALPDGDFVSIIQMASMQETRSIVDNQLVNASTRKLILSYISGLDFNKEGSDGYTMTSQIIESMNQTGSSDDMKYVFMFTDFEYWTKENQYNKNAVQWPTLGRKLKGKEGLKVYGLELFQKGGSNIRQGADYKDELKQIFGNVEYVSGNNSSFLNTWFNNTKANILSERLQYVLKRKTEKENAALILKASGLGNDLAISLKEENMSSVFSTAELDPSSLAEVQQTSEKRPLIGSFSPKPVSITVKAKLRSPKYKNAQKSSASSEYNEVDKLLDPQFAEFKVEVYEGKPYLPWYIGWPLVALLVFWIGSIVLQLLTFKSKKSWRIGVQVYEADEFSRDIDNQTFNNLPKIEIGNSASQYRIDDCGFDISIEIRKNVLLPFYKSGYFLVKKSGVSKMNYKLTGKLESAINKETFLCKQSKFKGCTIEVIRMDLKYKIRVI